VMGLREIKKQLTRESIAEAALQLALDHGLEQVTIEEIARVVFISPRTVSNYFSCKEEAIVAAGLQDSQRLLEDFAERPSTEPSLQSLCELLVNIAKGRSPEQQQLAQ
jgi:AcrR family transcriptional regulator